jgi:hypothetical protein
VTILRLRSVRGTAVDAAIAALDIVRLARTPEGAFADVDESAVERSIRSLALVGISAVACDIDLAAPSGSRAAIGRDLAPVPGLALDLVSVRRVPLGESTREVLRRRWRIVRPPSPAARALCRALLRGQDAELAWTRRAWGTAEAVRGPIARTILRPVFFDAGGVGAASHERRTFASDGIIGRWLF